MASALPSRYINWILYTALNCSKSYVLCLERSGLVLQDGDVLKRKERCKTELFAPGGQVLVSFLVQAGSTALKTLSPLHNPLPKIGALTGKQGTSAFFDYSTNWLVLSFSHGGSSVGKAAG